MASSLSPSERVRTRIFARGACGSESMRTLAEFLKYVASRAYSVMRSRELVGFFLYVVTVMGESMLAVRVRWYFAWLFVTILVFFADLDVSVQLMATGIAFGPIVWSVLGLAFCHPAYLWRHRQGGRSPVESERLAFEAALRAARGYVPSAGRSLKSWFVVDDMQPRAAVRGKTLMLTRGVFDFHLVEPVLAHELGHLDSSDSRLIAALGRLIPFPDISWRPEFWPEGALARMVAFAVRFSLYLALSAPVVRLLRIFWVKYWRAREYDADKYAASLGQGENLASFLEQFELPLDLPLPYVLWNPADYPPVASRIARLRSEYAVD